MFGFSLEELQSYFLRRLQFERSNPSNAMKFQEILILRFFGSAAFRVIDLWKLGKFLSAIHIF